MLNTQYIVVRAGKIVDGTATLSQAKRIADKLRTASTRPNSIKIYSRLKS